jgi:hypothetical protein
MLIVFNFLSNIFTILGTQVVDVIAIFPHLANLN